MGMIRDARPLVDSGLVRDTFASDLGRIDLLETNIRFVLFAEQFADEGAPPERQVCAKIVMPKQRVIPAINRVLFALGYAAVPGDLSSGFIRSTH